MKLDNYKKEKNKLYALREIFVNFWQKATDTSARVKGVSKIHKFIIDLEHIAFCDN